MLLVIALQLSSMLTSETRPRNENNSVAFHMAQIPSELKYRETLHQVNNAEHVPSTSRTNEFSQLAGSNQVVAQNSLIQVQNSTKITQLNTNKPSYPRYPIVFQPIVPQKIRKPEHTSKSSIAEGYLVDKNLLTYPQSMVPNISLIQQPLNVPLSIALNTHVLSNYMNISDVNPLKSCSTEHIADRNSTVIRNNEFYRLPQNSFDKSLEPAATEMRDYDKQRLTGDNKCVSVDKMVQSREIVKQANNQSSNEKPPAKRINILRKKAFNHDIRPQSEQHHTGWLNNAVEQGLDHERPTGLPHVSPKKYDCDNSRTIDSVGRMSVIQKCVQLPFEKKSIHIPIPFYTESITEYCSGQSSYKLNSAETISLPTKQFTFFDSQELGSKEDGIIKRMKFSDSKSINTCVSDVNPGKQDCLPSNSSIKTTMSSKAMNNVSFDLLLRRSKITIRKKTVEPLYNYAVLDYSISYVDRYCACSHLDISNEQLFCFIDKLWTRDFVNQLLDCNASSLCDLTGVNIMNFKNFVVFLKSCEKPKSKKTKTEKHSRRSSELTNPTVDSSRKFEKALRDGSVQISSEQDSKKLACENEVLLNDISHGTSCLDDITDKNNTNEMKSLAFLNQEDFNRHLSTIRIKYKDKNRDFFDSTLDQSEIFLFFNELLSWKQQLDREKIHPVDLLNEKEMNECFRLCVHLDEVWYVLKKYISDDSDKTNNATVYKHQINLYKCSIREMVIARLFRLLKVPSTTITLYLFLARYECAYIAHNKMTILHDLIVNPFNVAFGLFFCIASNVVSVPTPKISDVRLFTLKKVHDMLQHMALHVITTNKYEIKGNINHCMNAFFNNLNNAQQSSIKQAPMLIRVSQDKNYPGIVSVFFDDIWAIDEFFLEVQYAYLNRIIA